MTTFDLIDLDAEGDPQRVGSGATVAEALAGLDALGFQPSSFQVGVETWSELVDAFALSSESLGAALNDKGYEMVRLDREPRA